MKDTYLDRINRKIEESNRLAFEEIHKAYDSILKYGYKPVSIILCTKMPLIRNLGKDVTSYLGMDIEERKLYTPNGELIPIAFEIEDEKHENKLNKEEEEIIKKRLRELGYLE